MAERLRDMQALFLAGVMRGERGGERLIIDDNRVGAARRMDIYRNNYRASLAGVLADHYERLNAYLGEEQFGRLADAFIAAHPSTLRNLRYYGAEFTAFLSDRYSQHGELAELAALDWALRDAFDAPDTAALDGAAVGAMGDMWIERPLMLVPSGRLLPVRYNVAAIWNALDAGAEPPDAAPRPAPETLLVWRQGTQPQFRTLSDDEAAALALVDAGCSFTALSAAMLARLSEAAAMRALGEWLGRWLADGLLVAADRLAAGDQAAGSAVT